MDLPLSKRLKDSLSRLDIKTLCDIRKIEEEGFRRINDIGYKSINELKEFLDELTLSSQQEDNLITDDEQVVDVPEDVEPEPEVLNLLDCFEKKLSEREKFVIYNRVGLYGPEKTLEELGEIMGGITRERVRQLESRGIRILRDAYTDGILQDLVIERFKEYGDRVSFFSEIDLKNKWYQKDSLMKILLNIFDDEYQVITHTKLRTDKILANKRYALEKEFVDLINELSTINKLVSLNDLSEKFKIPVHIIKGINGILIKDGVVGLNSNKSLFYRGNPGKIYATLKRCGQPMSINDICKELNFTHNQVRGAIERLPDAVNVGLSMYALKEWGYLEGSISDVAFYYLKEANRPLSYRQLRSLIDKQRIVKENSIYAGLSNDERLVLLEDGYWALKEWKCDNVFKRRYQYKEYEIEATEALLDILNSKKEFMSLKQIVKLITTKYGDRASSSLPTYYAVVRNLKETGKLIELKQGRFCYYKISDET
jgi:hypothetical protein